VTSEGERVGAELGAAEGNAVGDDVGDTVGYAVGNGVGRCDGFGVEHSWEALNGTAAPFAYSSCSKTDIALMTGTPSAV